MTASHHEYDLLNKEYDLLLHKVIQYEKELRNGNVSDASLLNQFEKRLDVLAERGSILIDIRMKEGSWYEQKR